MESRRFPPHLGYPTSHREPKEIGTRVDASLIVGDYPNITLVGTLDYLEVADYIIAGGNVTVGGALAVSGNTTLGDSSSDTITFTGRAATSLLPVTTNTVDLGGVSNRFANVHVGTSILGADNMVLSFGTTAIATANAGIRVRNNQTIITARNAANTSNQVLMQYDSSNVLVLGGVTVRLSGQSGWWDVTGGHLFPQNTNVANLGADTNRILRGYFANISAQGINYTWPTTQSGTQYLQNNGAGALSWQNVSGLATSTAQYVTLATDSVLTSERVLTPESSVLTLTDAGAGSTVTIGVAANGITDAKLRQSAGLSVMGRSANTLGNVADITAGTDGFALRRSGTSVDFGLIDLSIGVTGALATGTVPASQVTAGTFGSGDYVFPSKVSASTIVVGADPDDGTGATLRGTGKILWNTGGGNNHVLYREAASMQMQFDTYGNTAGFGSNFSFRRARDTFAAPLQVVAGDSTGSYRWFAYINGTFREGLRITGEVPATETVSATSYPQRLVFYTTADGSTALTARWRLESAGHWFAVADNTYDYGASGANRPRTGYFGTSVVIGTDPGGSSALRVGGDLRTSGNVAIGAAISAGVGCRNDLTVSTASSTGGKYWAGGTITATANNDILYGYLANTSMSLAVGAFTGVNYSGVWVRNPAVASGTLATAYGLRIDSVTAGTTNKAILTGTGLVDFGDDVTVASGKVYKVNGTQVVSARSTGWTAPTATQSKAGFGNGATTTQLEQNLSAVINALITHGLLGA